MRLLQCKNILLIILVTMLLSFSGCANNNEDKKVDTIYEEYRIIINEIYECLQEDSKVHSDCSEFCSTGIIENKMSCDTLEKRMTAIAYSITDINNDGTKELIICDPNWSLPGNVRIIDMYTMVDDNVVKVITGWSRNRYYLLDDGYIYNEGSSGAAYSFCETLYFNANDGTLITQKLYFTYPKGENMNEGGYYYNENGEQDPSISVEISGEEYRSFMETCEEKTVIFDGKPFDLLLENS